MYNKYIKLIIIHCSDTEDNDNIGAYEIHKMHIGFGWNGIGYHKVIKRNGEVENGRPEYWEGAHTYGRNKQSLGVCLVGRSKFTNQQFSSLKNIIQDWKKKYPKIRILGHRDAIETNKTCPNFDVKEWCSREGIQQ